MSTADPSWSGETALKHTKAATNATTSDDLEGGECARWYEEPATTSKDPSPGKPWMHWFEQFTLAI